MQDAGARRVSNAESIYRIVRKHDCALPAQYTKHSNARGHSLSINPRTTSFDRPNISVVVGATAGNATMRIKVACLPACS